LSRSPQGLISSAASSLLRTSNQARFEALIAPASVFSVVTVLTNILPRLMAHQSRNCRMGPDRVYVAREDIPLFVVKGKGKSCERVWKSLEPAAGLVLRVLDPTRLMVSLLLSCGMTAADRRAGKPVMKGCHSMTLGGSFHRASGRRVRQQEDEIRMSSAPRCVSATLNVINNAPISRLVGFHIFKDDLRQGLFSENCYAEHGST